MKKPYTITIAEFRERIVSQLDGLPPTDEIFFGYVDLCFYRVKQRGEHLHQIEFNEVYSVEESRAD